MKRLVASLLLAFTILFATPSLAFAFQPFGGINCSNATDSAVCNDRGNGETLAGPNGLLNKITIIIAFVAGMAAVIVIILSGLRYITSSGDPKNVESAKNTLIGAVIGLVVIVAAEAIIHFVITQL